MIPTGTGCFSCHSVESTNPLLLPDHPHGTPLDIDDTLINNTCWSCHKDANPPIYVETHSNMQAAVCAIRDPETVKKAMKAGVGQVIDVELGGKGDKQGGEPVKGKAYAKSISDGRYTIVSPMDLGTKFSVGPAVGLQIGGVDVAVISGSMQSLDASHMKMVGFDPKDYRIVVVKSANHFRGWWMPVASEIVDSDPPGIATNDLTKFDYKKKTRKVFPLDKDAVYPEPGK